MRKLIHVPVIHTEADMGSMAEPLKKEYIQRYGHEKWNEHVAVINSMWQGIRQKVSTLLMDFSKTKIYQDGLPICGKELDIAVDLVRSGNQNYGIIMELVGKGAKLMGTENPGLLLEEYDYIKTITGSENLTIKNEVIKNYENKAQAILQCRDEFIADRIDKTLMDGEIGILFMGMKHKVEEQLPKDIEISNLIYRLPFRESIQL